MTTPLLAKAIERYQRGDNASARSEIEAVLAREPENAPAWYLAGVLRSLAGERTAALEALERSVALAPGDVGAQGNLGRLLLELGRPAEALGPLKRATALKTEDAAVWHCFGTARKATGDGAGAIKALRRAMQLDPRNPKIVNDLANLHSAENNIRTAEPLLRTALELEPLSARAHVRLARLLGLLGGHAQARALADRALALDPAFALGHAALSAILRQDGDHRGAVAAARRAIELEPTLALGHVNLALAELKLYRYEAALAAFDAALRHEPDNIDAHWNRGMLLVKLGRFKQGFADYEWRYRSLLFFGGKPRPIPKHPKPESFAGKRLVLLSEQGLGDTIMYLRYAKLAAALGATVTAEVRPPLRNLAARVAGVSAVVTTEDEGPAHDFAISTLSMPFVMGTTLETIPADLPYIAVPEAERARWSRRIEALPRPRIGLCWQGNPQNPNDRNRSLPVTALTPLVANSRAGFVSLQKGPGEGELTAAGLGDRVLDPVGEFADFTDTAALVAALDLVIAVDTSIAHLAGALARPVWTLLPYGPDYRWMLERADTPWYPTMRLFRQQRPEDWPSVIQAVAAALRGLEAPAR
jgi:tetratricopeptide (TPR) repeat protein